MTWKSVEDNSYVPYSFNKEACVIESKEGNYYQGVRIENISYPLTIPAVQAACCICLSEGEIPAKIYLQNTHLAQLHFWVQEFNLDVIESETPPSSQSQSFLKEIEPDFTAISQLKKLLDKAVVPCSNFPVSALLFIKDGYFEGVNIEVSDWTKGLCAERVALAKAISEGYKEFMALEMHTRKGEVSSPCGACRQVIVEHLPFHSIKLHHADGTLSEHLSIDLLPYSFKSSTLKK